jgi:hypothetical protein
MSGAACPAGSGAAFDLSGAPSSLNGGVNGLVLSGLEAPLTGALHVTLRARYGLMPNDTSLVPGFACRHFRHLFAFDGVAAVVRGDRLWVGCVPGASNETGPQRNSLTRRRVLTRCCCAA